MAGSKGSKRSGDAPAPADSKRSKIDVSEGSSIDTGSTTTTSMTSSGTVDSTPITTGITTTSTSAKVGTARDKPIPVTVLSGFLGAGKTTLLNHVLEHSSDRKIVVIVNDMSVVNIDARLVKRTEEKMIELSNGCICCSLREDLLEQLVELGETSDAEAIIIECTGVAEPIHVAETFAHIRTLGIDIDKMLSLDTMVTVVDAKFFFSYFRGRDVPEDVKNGAMKGCSAERNLVDLLIDQVQFADLVVLNKSDQISEQELKDVKAVLHDLNPHARHVQSLFGRVSPSEIIDTHLFSYDRASQHAEWFAQEWGSHELTPETAEYGITSFVFQEHRPFHPVRFQHFLSRIHQGGSTQSDDCVGAVIRGKGFVWLASRHDHFVLVHLAGGSTHLTYGGSWWADVPKKDWPQDKEFRKEVLSRWVKPYGDRSQTLVVIGLHMDSDAVRKALEACLLTKDEMALGPDGWKAFADPLPSTAISSVPESTTKSSNSSSDHKHDHSHSHEHGAGHACGDNDHKDCGHQHNEKERINDSKAESNAGVINDHHHHDHNH